MQNARSISSYSCVLCVSVSNRCSCCSYTLYAYTYIYPSSWILVLNSNFSRAYTISEKARDTHQIMNIYVNIVQHYARSAQLEKYAALYPSCAMWYISCRLYNRMRTFEEYRLTCVVCSFVMVFLGSGGGVLKAHAFILLERCEPIYNENNRHHLDFSVSYYMRESELYNNLCVSLLLCAFLPQKFWCLMFDVCMRYWSVTEQIRPLFFYDLYYMNALLAAVLIQT